MDAVTAGTVAGMIARGPWEALPPGYSPFKVICSLHGSPLLAKRGGAMELPDGYVDIKWQGAPPVSGDGIRHEDGSGTFVLRCAKCGKPKELTQDNLVRRLREAATGGDVDRRGVVVLDLAPLPF